MGIGQLAARDEAVARELVAAVRARGERLSYVNVPERRSRVDRARELGGTLDLRQYEMELDARERAQRLMPASVA